MENRLSIVICNTDVEILTLKYVTKHCHKSIRHSVTYTTSNYNLKNSSHRSKIKQIFFCVYMNSLNCSIKDVGSVQDNSFCGSIAVKGKIPICHGH